MQEANKGVPMSDQDISRSEAVSRGGPAVGCGKVMGRGQGAFWQVRMVSKHLDKE
jgi:hypothetical protein